MSDIPQEFPRFGGCGSGCGCGKRNTAKSGNGVVRAADIGVVQRKQDVVRAADISVVRKDEVGGGAYARFTAEQKRKMREEPGNKAAHRIVLVRRTVQIVTFGLFVLFFFMTTATSQ